MNSRHRSLQVEALESRTVLTAIAHFYADDYSVDAGTPVRLRAATTTNVGVDSVEFYLDSGSGQFEQGSDTLVAVDDIGGQAWESLVPTGGAYRILPLGDSITSAEWPYQSYRAPLWQQLTNAGYDFDFIGTEQGPSSIGAQVDPDHEGHYGWRTDEILAQLPTWINGTRPDIVLMHLGTNDLFQGQSIDSTINELESIINVVRQENPDAIILASLLIPSNFPSNALIDAFNAELPNRVAQWTTQRSPVVLVDANSPIDPVVHLYDGVHPNAQGEQIMASQWFADILSTRPLPNPSASFTHGVHTLFAVAVGSDGSRGPAASTAIAVRGAGMPNGTGLAGVNAQNELWVARSNGLSLDTTLAGVFPSNVQYTHFGSGDVNGDGLEDVVGRQVNGILWVALSEGNGNFRFEQWGELTHALGWTDFFVGDFDGNGQADVAARANTDGSWWISASNGSSFSTSRWGIYPTDIGWTFGAGDFNGDGRQDIVGRADTDGSWWAAISTGYVFQQRYWGRWNTSVDWIDIVVGDFNDDGRDDVAGRGDNAYWWVGTSIGNRFDSRYWGTWTQSVTWEDVLVGDFNGDGRDDIAGRANGQWWIAMPQVGSEYFRHQFWGRWTTDTTWDDVSVIDINQDGMDDIIGRAADGNWWTFVANANEQFTGVQAARWAALAVWQDILVGEFG